MSNFPGKIKLINFCSKNNWKPYKYFPNTESLKDNFLKISNFSLFTLKKIYCVTDHPIVKKKNIFFLDCLVTKQIYHILF